MGKAQGLPVLRTKKKLPSCQEAAAKGCAAQQVCYVKENVLRGIAEPVSGYKHVRWHDFRPCCRWWGEALLSPVLLPMVPQGFKAECGGLAK